MSYLKVLFGFDGRIRRTQYWLGHLAAIAIIAVIMIAGVVASDLGSAPPGEVPPLFWVALILAFVISGWTSVALSAKRWHDRDKSAVWVLIGLIPIVGGIWLLIENGFLDGTQGTNQYGPSPKGIGAAEKVF